MKFKLSLLFLFYSFCLNAQVEQKSTNISAMLSLGEEHKLFSPLIRGRLNLKKSCMIFSPIDTLYYKEINIPFQDIRSIQKGNYASVHIVTNDYLIYDISTSVFKRKRIIQNINDFDSVSCGISIKVDEKNDSSLRYNGKIYLRVNVLIFPFPFKSSYSIKGQYYFEETKFTYFPEEYSSYVKKLEIAYNDIKKIKIKRKCMKVILYNKNKFKFDFIENNDIFMMQLNEYYNSFKIK